jgi:DNA gyrase subunit A
MGRTASGVRGITLASETDEVIGMVSVSDLSSEILVVSENGYGKRSALDAYRETNRGGKGVKAMNITDKTGLLVSVSSVTDTDDLMIINKSGLTIRIRVSDLRVMGRNTQGVRLINIKGTDAIAAVAKVMREDDEEVEIDPSLLVSEEEQLEELLNEEPVEDIEEIDDEIIEDEDDQNDQE